MEDFAGFDLCRTFTTSTKGVQVHVWAEIKDGCLAIEGVDLGDALTQFFSRDEYEYGYRFDKDNTERLIALLPGEDREVKKLLYANFSGLEGIQNLKTFCRDNGITYKYWSWH